MDCPPLLALTEHPDSPHAHWRITRPYTRLREQGAAADWCWLGADRMPTLPVAGRVVVLQLVAMRRWAESEIGAWVGRLRAAGALTVVCELDDDVLSSASIKYRESSGLTGSALRAQSEQERLEAVWLLQACDGAIVSTGTLAIVAREYTDRPVITVPNAIDVDWFRARLAPRAPWADHLTIGWAGSRRAEADLEPMAQAWGRIARRYPDVRFVVGAGQPPECIYEEVDDERITYVRWAELDDWPKSMQVDIGCCAVGDTAFNRCKSPIKAWEYALAGAAVVATPMLYGDCLYQARAVRVAETAEEWEEQLSRVIDGVATQLANGRSLSRHVEAEHSLTANLHRWADAYNQIIASARVPV
jgi:hypothetical protein